MKDLKGKEKVKKCERSRKKDDPINSMDPSFYCFYNYQCYNEFLSLLRGKIIYMFGGLCDGNLPIQD